MTFEELGINDGFTTPITGNYIFRKVARTVDEHFALCEADGFLVTVSKYRQVVKVHSVHFDLNAKTDILKVQEPPQTA